LDAAPHDFDSQFLGVFTSDFTEFSFVHGFFLVFVHLRRFERVKNHRNLVKSGDFDVQSSKVEGFWFLLAAINLDSKTHCCAAGGRETVGLGVARNMERGNTTSFSPQPLHETTCFYTHQNNS
jgi:hypothetical protein